MKQDEAHIPFLDHMRGAAILLVFFYHSVFVSFWFSRQFVELTWDGLVRDLNASKSLLAVLPATVGWSGVAIFFVVSGFCIHLSHERSRGKSLKVFFLRRFFRIYPPYLLTLLGFAAVYPLSHSEFADPFGQIVSHLFLVHNFSETFHTGINASLWSIAVEVQLYALYPLLLWLATRLGWYGTLWVTALVEIGFRGAEGIVLLYRPDWWNPAVNFSWWYSEAPLTFWFSWTMGAALADAYLNGRPLPFRNVSGFLWPSLFILCYLFKPFYPFCFTLAALTSTYLIADLLSRPTLAFPSKGWLGLVLDHLRRTGIVSYSAYLIHAPILSQVPKVVTALFRGHVFPPLILYGFCLCSWPLVFALAHLLYRSVELPSIALGKRVIARSRGTPQPDGQMA